MRNCNKSVTEGRRKEGSKELQTGNYMLPEKFRGAYKSNIQTMTNKYLNIIFNIDQTNDIKETNVLTKFHENWAKNVTSRVFTCFHYIHIEKTAPPPGSHVFPPIWTIFELVRDINGTNVLTNFHDDWAEKTAPPTGGHVFQGTGTT
ncbi:hypothetical protein DPMN_010253 [Dreissena polymorpha]|uniref:Uncharacterized protein n=1 Tax=Dreissena polymorpha TaxID=45954 RepID=A0A9D4N171_DREPO|nr:hypothetical protein DPMN_010253 [Dreissena polymorpha]